MPWQKSKFNFGNYAKPILDPGQTSQSAPGLLLPLNVLDPSDGLCVTAFTQITLGCGQVGMAQDGLADDF